jgi:hypothetical protein
MSCVSKTVSCVSKTVYARAGRLEARNDAARCAERRVIERWDAIARKHDVPMRERVWWIRRKMGARLVVWRHLADGRLACAAPCNVCRDALRHFRFRVRCSMDHDRWFFGNLDDHSAPPVMCWRSA